MPADTTLPSTTSRHGDASQPYACSARAAPPRAPWSIDFGYCRTSLDHHPQGNHQGSNDPRCPKDCPHKAPESVAIGFMQRFAQHGAKEAAAWVNTQLPNK